MKSCIVGCYFCVAAAVGAAQAAPIVYTDSLVLGGSRIGAVPAEGFFNSESSDLSDYYSFAGRQGSVISLTVRRLEAALDPALWVFEGTFTDDDAFGGDGLDLFDPGFLAFADDELPPPPGGPFGDPTVRITLTLPDDGQYTAIVTNFASSTDDGDGVFPYEITLAPVPLPAGLPLACAGLVALALVRGAGRHRT